MFEDLQRQKAYLWYARYNELNRIQFWQSVCDDVKSLSFRRNPETRVSRLRQELHQLERELGHEYLRSVAKQDCWGGILPDWVNTHPQKTPAKWPQQ
jgi:hypothetical protein